MICKHSWKLIHEYKKGIFWWVHTKLYQCTKCGLLYEEKAHSSGRISILQKEAFQDYKDKYDGM